MQALAIVALIFSALSVFLPVVGVFMAMLFSVLAAISFRSSPTISGVALGINIVSTALLSPSIVAADVMAAQSQGAGSVYLFYAGWHVALLCVAVAWRLIRGPKREPHT